jgi:hypothetical protein
MDSADITTKCLACGKSVAHPMAWFETNPKCPACGGDLDREPLRRAADAAVKLWEQAKQFDAGFRRGPHDSN